MAMDPVSLVLVALASGTGQGVADSASDAVKAAYGKLKRLVADRLSGNKSAEVALAEHASDPETWQAPLAKALADTGVGTDESVVAAAQELMALLDEAGTRLGKYRVDLRGAQGVQVGDRNQQFNVFDAGPKGLARGRLADLRNMAEYVGMATGSAVPAARLNAV
jgi:hypothetical protein